MKRYFAKVQIFDEGAGEGGNISYSCEGGAYWLNSIGKLEIARYGPALSNTAEIGRLSMLIS